MKIFRDLKVDLSEPEWRSYAEALAREMARRDETLAEKAEAMSKFKSRLEVHANVERDLGFKVHSHEETRPVECMEKLDYERFVVELYRTDTGELIETRAMTATERQTTFGGMS